MDLPEPVAKGLDLFINQAEAAFGARLLSVVLYGSAAEGRLRKTSDVNVVLVAQSFTAADASALRSVLTFTAAAIDLHVMFLLESEIPTASELFAVKFSDITRRRKVLYGSDPFGSISIPKEVLVSRLQQVLLNHLLRLRYLSALRNESAEQLTQILADSISPLRASASGILEVRGIKFDSPKHALHIIAQELREDGFEKPLSTISETRDGKTLTIAEATSALADVLELTQRLIERITSLS